MFAMISLLALIAGYKGVPAADTIVCPGPDSGPVSTVSGQQAPSPGWPDWSQLPKAPTSLSDAMVYGVPGASWFASHAGGARAGEELAYDVTHQLMLSCARYDTAMGMTIWSLSPNSVPAFIPRVHLGAVFATAAGVRIGSTPARVRAIYGPAPLQRLGSNTTVLVYEKQDAKSGNLHYVVDTTFFFKNAKLVGIYRLAGI